MNTFGHLFRVTTFGESHGKAVGALVDGCPPGLSLCEEDVAYRLRRRRPGQSDLVTPREEEDRPHILSGVFDGVTTGTPIAVLVWNRQARSRDYEEIKDLYRPGHADYTYGKKYGVRDWRGSGRASGRETVGRVAGGAVARKLLGEYGVEIEGGTVQIGKVKAGKWVSSAIESNPVRSPDPEAAGRMAAEVERAKEQRDSVGGMVEVRASGVPPGLGEPVFAKLDAVLTGALASIGAVKGVEAGAGFRVAEMKGSEANDPVEPEGFVSNNCGGILGGISNGSTIVLRCCVKPPSSIGKPQKTVDTSLVPREISIGGRHDPCICPRVVPVAEAMVALCLADFLLRQRALRPETLQRKQ